MKKHTLALVCALLLGINSLASALTALPEGTFSGDGKWKFKVGNDTGTYWVDLEIKNGVVTSIYRWNGKVQETSVIETVDLGRGFFSVKHAGRVVGDGYCFEDSCHLDYSAAGRDIEETYTLVDKVMHRIGSRYTRANQKKEIWTERLK